MVEHSYKNHLKVLLLAEQTIQAIFENDFSLISDFEGICFFVGIVKFIPRKRRVDDSSFLDYSNPFCFSLIEFYCTFPYAILCL